MSIPAVHLWLVLWKAHDSVQAQAVRSIEALGMCLTDFGVLEMLLHKGPLPVNVVGAKLRLTSGSMTAAVDRLERRALVERRDDAADRRARVVHLTAEGRKLIAKAFREHEAHLEAAVGSAISEHERATLIELLKKLGKGADRHKPPEAAKQKPRAMKRR